jgi:hypothetical protein
MKDSGRYSAEETEQRLRKILRGAFAGPPTQLKDIPTREGKSPKAAKKHKVIRAK